jgi:hypothetical protein
LKNLKDLIVINAKLKGTLNGVDLNLILDFASAQKL